jgi:mannan endo-1,4-beta-mannosidase
MTAWGGSGGGGASLVVPAFVALAGLGCHVGTQGAADPEARRAAVGSARSSGFVRVHQGRFELDGSPHRFVGVNWWAAVNLAVDGPSGDRARFLTELEQLRELGVTNLRIMAASEGPGSEPYRLAPAMQESPGEYEASLWDALDFVLAECGKRDMRVVMVLGNFWEWSGGMAQYVSWAEGSKIPYSATHDWTDFTAYATKFYSCEQCEGWYREHVRRVVERRNTMTEVPYRDDPTIFAWELANEPRYYPESWIDETAAFIDELDPNHMITTGSEGRIGGPFASTHDGTHVDYATIHIWPQNWEWFDPKRPDTFDAGAELAAEYIAEHSALAEELGKPVVIEEFGLARDWEEFGNPYDPRSATELRDRFFSAVFGAVEASTCAGGPLMGSNLWAWGGRGRPGDAWVGDPPHEKPGWYSVYDNDLSTLTRVAEHAAKLQACEG